MKRRDAARCVGLYTLLAVLMGGVCLSGLLSRGVIWNVDGLMQHYPFMKAIGDWLRDALSGNFHAFDFSLGFGSDVLVSLNYYGLGDPLLMLIALIAGASEWGMVALILIRMWLCGLSCMLLAKKYGYSQRKCIAAGLVYALSAGMLSGAATRQVLFLNAYIHFPLMLAGLEDVFEKRSGAWLTVSVWFAALSGFYMLYCESVLLLVCALIRYFTRREKRIGFFPAVGRAIGRYALGLGLSAIVFLPATLGFLDGQRLSNAFDGSNVRAFYSLEEILSVPLSFLTAHGTGAAQPMIAIGLIGLIPLMLKRSERSARAFVIAGLLAALTPLTGWALNGFSYETTRWSFALSLLCAMVGVYAAPYAFKLSRKNAILICAALAAYPLIALATGFTGVRKLVLCGMLLLIGLSGIGLVLRGKFGKIVIVGVCVLQIGLNCWDVWLNRAEEILPFGESEEAYSQSVLNGLSEFPRTDSDLTAIAPLLNASAWSGTAGTSVYNSTISGKVFAFMQDVGCAGLIQENAICGLDGRAALETVWSVGRYVGACAPYGFSENEDGVYENQYALPIGYAYTSSISTAYYETLSPLEKQWALLQCAVLDDAEGNGAAESLQDVPILRVEWENVDVNGDILTVHENACIRLTFDAPADCELYLTVESLEYHGSEIALGNYVTFTSGEKSTAIHLMPSGFELALADRAEIIVHLGYDASERTTAEIRFARTGEYRMGSLTLAAQPMADYEKYVTALKNNGLTDVQIGNDCVKGKIGLDSDGVVVYAIPYSRGWTAEVDGKAAEITCSAKCMLAVPVASGEHEIVIAYRTPGLRAGGAITAASALIAGILCFRKKNDGKSVLRRRKWRKPQRRRG